MLYNSTEKAKNNKCGGYFQRIRWIFCDQLLAHFPKKQTNKNNKTKRTTKQKKFTNFEPRLHSGTLYTVSHNSF